MQRKGFLLRCLRHKEIKVANEKWTKNRLFYSWGCKVNVLSPEYTHETWLNYGVSKAYEIGDLRSGPQFDLVINTGGPLMQDICHKLATKRVVTTILKPPHDLGQYHYYHIVTDLLRL